MHAVIYFLVCGFLLFAAFFPPGTNSPFSEKQSGTKSYLVPSIGLSTLLWGVIWWTGLLIRGKILKRTLEVTRVPNIGPDEDDLG